MRQYRIYNVYKNSCSQLILLCTLHTILLPKSVESGKAAITFFEEIMHKIMHYFQFHSRKFPLLVAIALSLRLTLKGFQVSKSSSNLKNTQQVL